MPRRSDADPLSLQVVSERLARLLAESPARRTEDDPPPVRRQGVPGRAATSTGSTETAPDVELIEVDDLPPPRRFGRRHLAVVCVLLLAGLLWSGWSTLRARPVAIASPVTASASAAPSSSPRSSALPPGPSPSAGTPRSSPAGGPTTSADTVVVHVLGAVRRPGLVTLSGRARVQDAVEAAGGFSRNADPGELNLAQLLQDGQQVVIGTTARPSGEVRSSGASTGGASTGGGSGPSAGDGGAGDSSREVGAPIDLNVASETQLDGLPGVGPVTAGKIIAWRGAHGRFSRVEELQEVDGIGPKTYAQIAPRVRV